MSTWTYEPERSQDHGGADTFHHIVEGDRHVAEVASEADARRIIASQDAAREYGTLGWNACAKAIRDLIARGTGDFVSVFAIESMLAAADDACDEAPR